MMEKPSSYVISVRSPHTSLRTPGSIIIIIITHEKEKTVHTDIEVRSEPSLIKCHHYHLG